MDDSDWTPPSEAELEILKQKRKRSDRVSALMGQYMLKGYRMFFEIIYCPVCSSILLQTPQAQGGVNYCVSCVDVAAEEAAAQTKKQPKAAYVQPKSKPKATLVKSSTPILTVSEVAPVAKTEDVENVKPRDWTSMDRVQQLIGAKMVALAEELNTTTSPTATRELLALIKECSETISHVKHACQ
ncbi:Oidioi.mRNA.OKI2018_I69.PAR.g11939.t1.cds [Oikopleura dioica]|uniref:Oidioi.mRNA.OKI2018_I69.PAR.g11939.t1.cds n=1 Tax=Oikopleura dioica TaxID=34765 RepID=A0ABN7RYF3_OIKDI|nr:Oidioi.mRNA.OKI2018_I69.PAR.g11939.t1.cds [Oikopleura dioica]